MTRKTVIPIILTLHCLVLLCYSWFCKDPDNPEYWGIVYYIQDPLFFFAFAMSINKSYSDTPLINSFVNVWGLMNLARVVAYTLNFMGFVGRAYNFYIILAAIVIATSLILVNGIKHGTFKSKDYAG